MSELIPFHGMKIRAVSDSQGDIWLFVDSVCEALGIDVSSQAKKLKNAHWAISVIMTDIDCNGRAHKYRVLRADCAPYWFATIRPGKVKRELCPLLKRLQLEIRDVLAAYFSGKTVKRKQQELSDPRIQEILDLVRASHHMIAVMYKRSQEARQNFSNGTIAACQQCIAVAFHGECPACDRKTDVVEVHHWRGKASSQPKYAFAVCRQCHHEAETEFEWEDRRTSRFRVFQEKLKKFLPARKKPAACEGQKKLF